MTFVGGCMVGMNHEYADFVELMDLNGRYRNMPRGTPHLWPTLKRFGQAQFCFVAKILFEQIDFGVMETPEYQLMPFY